MSILIDRDTRVIVQGITGRQASFHTRLMIEYGTKVVAGTSPGKGGRKWEEKIPVFDHIGQIRSCMEVDASIIFVPPAFAAESIHEAIENDLKIVVCITDGIPQQEMMLIKRRLKEKNTILIGPNCPGLISPEEAKMGIMPGHIYKKGPVGIISRSGSLSYEIAYGLTLRGLGQSTVVGIGGDPVKGVSFVDLIPLFEEDIETKVIVLISEIGGTDEEKAAEYIAARCSKPVVAYIVGKMAPPGKKMGHAGAIVSQGKGTYTSKINALREAGVTIAETPMEVPNLVLQKI